MGLIEQSIRRGRGDLGLAAAPRRVISDNRNPGRVMPFRLMDRGRVARQLHWMGLIQGVIQMENVQFEVVDGNRLVIHVGLNHRGDISASGKTRRVASTEGNVGIKDANGVEIKIGLNVYVKPDSVQRISVPFTSGNLFDEYWIAAGGTGRGT